MGKKIISCFKPRCLRPKTKSFDDEGQQTAQEKEDTAASRIPTPPEGDKNHTGDEIKQNRGFRREDVEEYRAVFDYFDTKSKGHIKVKEVATVLRSLHPVPDEHLVAKEVAKVSECYGGVCTFDQFLEVLNSTIRTTRKSNRKKDTAARAIPLSEERRAEMKESFDMFDYDKDGTIDLNELQRVMASCGVHVTEDEASDIITEFGHLDSERENLNFDEFVDLMTSKENHADANKELQEAFDFFDKDGSGSISADEVKAVMEALGEVISDNDVFDMIKEADTQGNGEVCYQDFKKILTGGCGN